ncbi:MAG: AmmeMemoRadiSam system protein B [Treponema sp.]|nr:AmmeMemoRadiSam system protein B [Treponema sp.]
MILKKIKAVRRFVFLAAFFILFGFLSCSTGDKSEVIVKYQYPDDLEMWNHIFGNKAQTVIPQKIPASIIIPHHDITAKYQNSFYRAISKLGQPSVIVVISPDHFEKGEKQIVIPCRTFFDAPGGQLNLSGKLQSDLTKDSRISENVDMTIEPWIDEHGIYIHTPFIKHYFPDAEFFPILLKSFSAEEEFDIYKKLAEVLNDVLPEDALVVASVDFSHYQIPRMTELHDYVSMNTIQNMEDLKHIEVDSPESLTVVTEFSKLRGADFPVLINRTSTFDFIPDEFVVSTSHQYWTFYSKEDEYLIEEFNEKVRETKQRINFTDYENTKNQTILIGGSGNIGAGIRNFWKWDRYKKSKDPVEQKLYNLAGTEARFLNGFDALIFDIEPGKEFYQIKHKTPLFVIGSDFENSDKVLENERIINSENNQINIVVITDNRIKYSGDDFPLLLKVIPLLDKFDFVVLRDSSGQNDAYAFTKTPGMINQYNLGIFANEKNNFVKGQILCVNWHNGEKTVELFDYENMDSYPPAILQGEI